MRLPVRLLGTGVQETAGHVAPHLQDRLQSALLSDLMGKRRRSRTLSPWRRVPMPHDPEVGAVKSKMHLLSLAAGV